MKKFVARFYNRQGPSKPAYPFSLEEDGCVPIPLGVSRHPRPRLVGADVSLPVLAGFRPQAPDCNNRA